MDTARLLDGAYRFQTFLCGWSSLQPLGYVQLDIDQVTYQIPRNVHDDRSFEAEVCRL